MESNKLLMKLTKAKLIVRINELIEINTDLIKDNETLIEVNNNKVEDIKEYKQELTTLSAKVQELESSRVDKEYSPEIKLKLDYLEARYNETKNKIYLNKRNRIMGVK